MADEVNQPWRVFDSNGEVSGFQVDVLRQFSAILGVDMVSGLPGVKLGIQSDRNDVDFGPLLSREELLFIDYTTGRPSFVFPLDGDGMEAVTDLCGHVVSHLEGSVAFDNALDAIDEECAAAGESAITRLPLADVNAVILSLESQRADYGGMAGHQATYAEVQNPHKIAKYISTEDEFAGDPLGMDSDPSDVELAEVMFEAWKIVLESGSYDELMDKYNMQDIKVDTPTLSLDAAEQ